MNRNYTRSARRIKNSRICFYCGKHIKGHKDLTIDHIIPLIQGGTNNISNLVCSCSRCNEIKGSKTIYETILQLEKDLNGLQVKEERLSIKILKILG